jgi:branched-chain amino acid transport system permease protein
MAFDVKERLASAEIDFPSVLKEAGLAGLVTLGLAIFMVGLKTTTVQGGLELEQRWMWVGISVAVVFIGRAALAIRRQTKRVAGRERRELVADRIAVGVQIFAKYAGPVLIVFAIAMPWMPFANRYIVDIATLVVTYIMLGWGLNIVVGLAGLLDLGYVAFYAIGAYSFALFALNLEWGFWACLPLAGGFAAMFGLLLGFPVLRLRGDYLAIVTLAFGEMIRVILLNWYPVTKGPDGLSGIPRPSFFGLPFTKRPGEGVESFHTFFGLEYASMQRIVFLYYVILALALITNSFTLRIRKLPIGRAWEALREDEIACRSLGINPTNTKLTAFAIGAMFGGFAGSFFATRQGFISPESFTFIESAVILAIVVLGGMGSQIGVVIASVVLIGGTELLRELEEFRMLAFGAAMVAIMVWRPRGLLAHRNPTIRLHGKRTASKGSAP